MTPTRCIILRAAGINCDLETEHAWSTVGVRADRIHVNRLIENPALLSEYQILTIPGGFSYGDDVAAGKIFANQLRYRVHGALQEFQATGKLVLGICNGFQVLLKAGVLVRDAAAENPPATLAWNASGKFEDRWVNLKVRGDRCVFLRGIDALYLPVAHAEGKFVTRDAAALERLVAEGRIVLTYDGLSGSGGGVVPYPDNPNGSQANVAAVRDETGRVLGLMPHPERHIARTHHPRWTRGEGTEPGDGLRVFENAAAYFRD